jgi:O-acetyl-ADP-ribose deacetylase
MRTRFIIHAVAPIWRNGTCGEACSSPHVIRGRCDLLGDHNVKSVAFPSISTGAFRYPIELAAPIAIAEVLEFVRKPTSLEKVVFCCFSYEDFALYRKLLRKTGTEGTPRPR